MIGLDLQRSVLSNSYLFLYMIRVIGGRILNRECFVKPSVNRGWRRVAARAVAAARASATGARQRAETVANICDGRTPARRNGGEYLRLARASAPKRW